MNILSTLENLSPDELDRLQKEVDLTQEFIDLAGLVVDNSKPDGDPEIMNRALTRINAIHAADQAKKGDAL